MKIGMVSLGCSKNRVDSEIMLGSLTQHGHSLTPEPAEADVIIVNTCGFIEAAKQESIDSILEMAEYKKQNCKYLLVSGCLSERYIRELPEALPEVDGFLGVGDFHRIHEILKQLSGGERIIHESKPVPSNTYARVLTTPNYYAYLKIAEGCNNRCSYCAIPMIKGPYKSGDYDAILAEARRLCDSGVKELVLIAQDTTRYGMESGKYLLPSLITDLCQIPNLHWLRILYAYPECVSDELLDVMANEPKVCKYLDVPIQHISDQVLSKMNRTSNQKQILTLLDKLRQRRFTIRTTLIVGFPEESEQDFQQLADFVRIQQIDRMGVFPYSQEENTPAASMPQVDEAVKLERYDKIMRLQADVSQAQNEKRVGSKEIVLIEGFKDGKYYGRSQREAPEIDGQIWIDADELTVGEFYPVSIIGADEYDLYGEIADEHTK